MKPALNKYVRTFAEVNSMLASLPYFVRFQMLLVLEVCRGCEQMHKSALHALVVDALSNQLAHQVLSGACPAMQREDQGFLGVRVLHVSGHCFQDYPGCHMLAKELLVQGHLQICVKKINTTPQRLSFLQSYLLKSR